MHPNIPARQNVNCSGCVFPHSVAHFSVNVGELWMDSPAQNQSRGCNFVSDAKNLLSNHGPPLSSETGQFSNGESPITLYGNDVKLDLEK